jgi:hypothetical protein
MRSLLSILSLLCALPIFGQLSLSSPGFVSGLSQTGTGSSRSWLVRQTCEGSGYDNGETWNETTGGGTINEDETGTVLQGSQSLLMEYGSTDCIDYVTHASVDQVWCRLMVRWAEWPASTRTFLYVRNNATSLGRVYIDTARTLHVYNGGSVATTVATLSLATTYYIWVRCKPGSGSNAELTVAFATTLSEPAVGDYFASVSDGTSTAQANRLELILEDDGTVRFDEILVDDTAVGNESL